MEIVRSVGKWGNSAGVLLPREWMGNQVKVVLIERTLDIKKEVMEILEPYLEDIIGIYLTGSYARGEQGEYSDIDVIAISRSASKEIKSGKYSISIVKLEGVRKSIIKNPILILPRLLEAKTIINDSLLAELKSIEIKKSYFKEFIEECERIIRINKKLIELDKDEGEELKSLGVIYSLILRLRGIFIANLILKRKKYYKMDFLNYIYKEIGKDEGEEAYRIYTNIRDDKKVKESVKIETAEKLLSSLQKGVRKLKDEKKKEA